MFRRSHIPLVPRTATYSCSLANRSPRKRTVCSQTDRCLPPSFQIQKGNVNLDEESTKTYCTALEYVNSFHAYMNKKLSEKYGESGDTKPEGNDFFKLPEVPNYITVFYMLLERTKGSKLPSGNGNVVKKKVNSLKAELQPKKYLTKESVLDFVPETKNKSLELNQTIEKGVQTAIKDEDSISCPTKTISDDISPLSSLNSSDSHTTPPDECTDLEKDKDFNSNEASDTGKGLIRSEEADKDVVVEQLVVNDETNKDNKIVMMEIIKKRVQEEIITYMDKSNTKNDHPRLIRSHFHVVNIQPQINLLEYAQKKLERQLASEPKSQKQFVSAKQSLDIRPGVKVADMFRKLSQEDCNVNLEAAIDLNHSDGDSVILDDEEFEKINGHAVERSGGKLNGIGSADKEKSNPLKLTIRDMSKVNQKVLNTIGIFTERGEIRPEVIDMLEEQRRVKAKDSRNKQFRSRRQWDLQIHLNPKSNINSSLTSISSEKSFISLSSTELRSELETVKNVQYEE